MGFLGGSEGKESACSARHQGLIPGLGRSTGEGMAPTPGLLPGEFHGPGARQTAGHGVAERNSTE